MNAANLRVNPDPGFGVLLTFNQVDPTSGLDFYLTNKPWKEHLRQKKINPKYEHLSQPSYETTIR